MVLKALKDKGLESQTAVVFTTDHNRYDGKATCYEGGVHIPAAIKWPGKIAPGTHCDQRMSLLDLMPTFAEMAGRKLPDTLLLDGKSRLKYLLNPELETEDQLLFFEFGYSRAVLSGEFK